VKKPLNPILGEIFTCHWDFPDNTRGYYISEQTSHHPPKSSYFYMVPGHNIRVDGTLKPRSKFLGNSAASMMEGTAILTLLNRGKNPKRGERYILTQPNMYARGILFGKMKYELGDRSIVRCPELGLSADIEFKTKGWVSGTYNAIGGTIKNEFTGEVLYELSGLWSEEMFVKDLKAGLGVLVLWIFCLQANRLDIRICSLTHTWRNPPRHYADLSRSRSQGNHRGCGTRPHKQSRRGTTKSPPTRRQRSRRSNAKRRPLEPTKGLSGIRDYSGESEVAWAVLKRAKRTSNGSLTRR